MRHRDTRSSASSRIRLLRYALIAAALVGVVVVVAGLAETKSWRIDSSTGKAESRLPANLTTFAIVRRDLVDMVKVDGTVTYGNASRDIVNQAAGVLTSLPPVGAVVRCGQTIYAVNNSPVVMMCGDIPAWRPMSIGINGPDVKQLEQGLIALGERQVAADGRFSWAVREAVRRWQARIGIPMTGAIEFGRVIFMPGAIRIASHAMPLGSTVASGSQPFAITTDMRVVVAEVDASIARRLRIGDSVQLSLPNSMTAGRVVDLDVQRDSTTGGATTRSTVTIAADLPAIDGETVRIAITLQRVAGVLAVPITALLGLAEGGYGLEIVDSNNQRRLVPANTGLFDETDNLVEVSGPDLSEGVLVVVPKG